MDTLHDRLAELADDAPTGGAPAAELWARGKRAHRLRVAALAATLVVVLGAVGTGIGVRLADGGGNRSGPAPAGPDQSQTEVGIALPIEYPGGEELTDLGDTPGPLAAIWLAPRVGGGAPEVVGLVAETGMFGTLPIDVSYDPDPRTFHAEVALSPDGRRIAYVPPNGELIVRDLVSGESNSWAFEFDTRGPGRWVDATHLLGYVAEGSDIDGWLWEPGTTPQLVNPYLVPYAGTDLALPIQGGGPRECWSPTLQNLRTRERNPGDHWAGAFEVPMLCDVLGITGSEILLGHWNSDHIPGDWKDPNDGNGTVVALDIHDDIPDCPQYQRGPGDERCQLSFEDPALRHVVATAGAPQWSAFASDLIAQALDAEGGAS